MPMKKMFKYENYPNMRMCARYKFSVGMHLENIKYAA